MYPEIERAYKASVDAANDLAWEEFAKIGVRKGSTVTARVAVVRHYLGGHGIVKATGKVGADKHGRPVLKTKEGVDLPGKRRPVKTFHITADAVVR